LQGDRVMTEDRVIERETVTESSPAPRETVEKDYVAGVPHGDEEAKDDTVVVTREVRR